MAQPILSIAPGQNDRNTKTTVNLLPCRVDHDGPIDDVASFWYPTKENDGSNVAYFRGRKLQGKAIPLPQEYKGVLLAREEKPENQATPAPQSSTGVVTIEDDDDDDDVVAEKMLTVGKFDELVVWGHEVVADAADDQYVRSIEEWLQVADQIHSYPELDAQSKS